MRAQPHLGPHSIRNAGRRGHSPEAPNGIECVKSGGATSSGAPRNAGPGAVFQYRVDFHERQAAVVLSIGAVQPRKCAVRVITIGVYLSDLACPLVLAIGDKLLQSGV